MPAAGTAAKDTPHTLCVQLLIHRPGALALGHSFLWGSEARSVWTLQTALGTKGYLTYTW